ncbi:MAG: type II secretion system F family protein, partial [Methyloprofundus sp.]|nr:type II secretion system F family protein [Methyloprofundus sp.]
MPSFKYTARNKQGNLIEATIEANSAQAVASLLIAQDIAPIRIAEFTPDIDLLAQFNQWQDIRSLNLDDLILFNRQMYSLTKAGVPIIRAIHSLIESTHNKALSSALSDIASALEGGLTMGKAMEQHPKIFNSLFLNVIKVGESTGSLDQGFLQISEYLMREKETQSRIKSALQYPTMVIIAISIAMMIVNVYVIPAFKGV